jgi:hypothetical protein
MVAVPPPHAQQRESDDLRASKPSNGYTHLYERGYLNLTVEALVAENSKWHSLFTAEEIGRAPGKGSKITVMSQNRNQRF